MTDKEKLDAIRAEIHRLVDIRGYDREMANDLFAFMDSLKEDELTKDEQKVSNAYCRKIRDKRVLPILKGESKHKFINEFNTLYQTLDMQLCDKCMKEPLKDLCLAFATWGAYNLKYIGGISKEEITKMDSLQEEPVSEDLEKEIINYIGFPQEIDEDISTTMIRKAARHFANWQKERDQKSMEIMDEVYFKSCDMIRKQMIDKACKYLQEHREEVETEDNGIAGWISNKFIEKFSKYLEE